MEFKNRTGKRFATIAVWLYTALSVIYLVWAVKAMEAKGIEGAALGGPSVSSHSAQTVMLAIMTGVLCLFPLAFAVAFVPYKIGEFCEKYPPF